MEDIVVNTPRTPVSPEFAPRPAKVTDRQRSFLLDLIRDRYVKPDQQAKLDTVVKSLRISEDPEEFGMSKDDASKLITWFLKQPMKPKDDNTREIADPHAPAWNEAQARARNSDVPDGYYALKNMPGHSNETTFYRLRTGRNAPWIGFQFIDQVVGHGKRYPVKGPAASKVRDVIKEQGINEARQLYGQEIGACGRCGRELTDDTSRARGIGPDCWAIMGL